MLNNGVEDQVIEGEISLVDIWNVIRRRFILIILILVVFIFTAVLSLQDKVKMYTSSAVLIIQKPNNSNQNSIPDYYSSQGWLQTYAEMLRGEPVLRETALRITYPRISIEELRKNLTIQAVKDTLLLKVSYNYQKPAYAKKVVDTVSDVFIQKMSEMNESTIQSYTKKLQEQIVEFQNQIDSINTDLKEKVFTPAEKDSKQQELKRLYELKGILDEQLARQILSTEQLVSSVKVYQEGTLPTIPSNSKDSLTIAIAGVLGLFVGFLLAFLLEYLDDTIKTEEDLKKISNNRVLGVIPRFDTKAGNSYYSPYANEKYYQKLS